MQARSGAWFLLRIRPYRTLENVIEGAVVTFADITELRRAQEGMRRLAVVVRDSRDAILVQALDGRILAWNPGAERSYGWSEAEALAMNIRALVPEPDRDLALARVREVASGHEVAPYTARRLARDGRVIDVWLTAAALVDASGQSLCDRHDRTPDERGAAMNDDLRRRAEVLAGRLASDPALTGVLSAEEVRLMHDLQVHQIELEIQNEELRRAEAALEGARARYFDLYDVAPVGYVTLGPGNRILEANLTAARVLRVERAALVGEALTRYIVADDQDTFYLRRRRLLATGIPQVVELRMRRGDDPPRWVRLEATTTPDMDGLSEVCRVVLSDITDEKRLAGERAQFERELQHAQKAESLGRMAGAVAHHFNNQLMVVMGNLDIAMNSPATSGPWLAGAQTAAHKAAAVSGLLLTYVGQSSGNHAPIDLSAAVEHGLPLVRAAMPRHVTIETDLPAPGAVVNANPDELRLLFTNLVTNAWESVGGLPATIHARAYAVNPRDIPAARRIPVGWTPRDQMYACLEVRDPGCGIDAQEIEQIFDPFFTHKFTGRGLGLSVVLGILHAPSGGTGRREPARAVERQRLPCLPADLERTGGAGAGSEARGRDRRGPEWHRAGG